MTGCGGGDTNANEAATDAGSRPGPDQPEPPRKSLATKWLQHCRARATSFRDPQFSGELADYVAERLPPGSPPSSPRTDVPAVIEHMKVMVRLCKAEALELDEAFAAAKQELG